MLGAVKRLVVFVAFVAAVAFGLQILASESGEVVVLRTFVGGAPQETRVWIVDDRGVSWLRAGRPEAGWYQRVRQDPDIQIERGSELYEYRAFPVESGPSVDHVNMLMFQKYGWAEDYIGLFIDRSRSVAIRLDPR
jgi:hypothetical protein